jgi:signal transduction histidine kinase
VYRVVQEALNNIAKHASAGKVTMRVERIPAGEDSTGLVTVTVVDDGIGVDTTIPTQGLGLIGMRERVAALAGRLAVTSTPGRGFQLQAQIPVEVWKEQLV